MAALLSPLLQSLREKLTSTAIEEVGLKLGLGEDVEWLWRCLSRLGKVLPGVEEREIMHSSVSLWLGELRGVLLDLEDLLEEVEYEALRRRLEEDELTGGEGRHNKSKVVRSSLFSFLHLHDTFRLMVKSKMSIIRTQLEVSRDVDARLHLREADSKGRYLRTCSSTSLETSPLLTDALIVGREEERVEIVQLLLEGEEGDQHPHPRPFSVLSIVGMGGVGKTTMAQLVYNDDLIAAHFQVMDWIYVGSDSDLHRVAMQILEKVQKHSGVSGKRFLLVLDDVWVGDPAFWAQAFHPLESARKGSRILVTTRNQMLAHYLGGSIFYLGLLSSVDCWTIFRSHAFHDESMLSDYPDLVKIGRVLVGRTGGLPLAVRYLGGLLRFERDVSKWQDVLRSEIWELDDHEGILPVLRLSYNHLTAHLKQCFAFCFIFPRGFVFEKSELIQMWMAHGFIHSRGDESMEDVGGDYFHELCMRSFFSSVTEDRYVMHDLIHDLARSVSQNQILLVENDSHFPMSKFEDLYHVSLFSADLMKTDFYDLLKHRHLRTLQLRHRLNCDSHHMPVELLMPLKHLRVLVLHCQGIRELPASICELMHLRYLDLSHTSIRELPQMLTKIYNLQTLKVVGCPLRVFPRSTSNLINLRHLEADPSLVAEIYRIGKLTALQELKEFMVHDEDGHRLGELKDMKELHGCLSIRNLDIVQKSGQAEGANLTDKIFLSALVLEWCRGDDDMTDVGIDEHVLEGLRPNNNLRMLHIKNNGGVMPPGWLDQPLELEEIFLDNCTRWTCLPSLGQLSKLKSLKMKGLKWLKQIDNEFCGEMGFFAALENLQFHDMPEWKEWSWSREDKLFPKLQKLDLKNCPRLTTFPQLPNVLTELKVEKVGLTALPEIQEPHECAQDRTLSLTSLHVSDCPNIKFLFGGNLPSYLPSLRALSIIACKELMSLPDRWLGALVSLKSLLMGDCPKLVSLPASGFDLPSSLEVLQVRECPGIVNESFFTNLQRMTSISSSLITKGYSDLNSCTQEALKCLDALHVLKIQGYDEHGYMSEKGGPSAPVFFRHAMDNDSSEPKESLPSSEVDLMIGSPDCISVNIGALTANLTALTSLDICECPNLVSLQAQDLIHLSKLEKLAVAGCKELTSLALPSLDSLKHLKIEDCHMFSSITLDDQAKCNSLQAINLVGFFNEKPSVPQELTELVSSDYVYDNSHSQASFLSEEYIIEHPIRAEAVPTNMAQAFARSWMTSGLLPVFQ